jgi:hypothetical protein
MTEGSDANAAMTICVRKELISLIVEDLFGRLDGKLTRYGSRISSSKNHHGYIIYQLLLLMVFGVLRDVRAEKMKTQEASKKQEQGRAFVALFERSSTQRALQPL